MDITILTLFPEVFEGVLAASIMKRAQAQDLVRFNVVNFREYAKGLTKKVVDDMPYGGGPGMLLKPEPLFKAVEDVQNNSEHLAHVVLLTPHGRTMSQAVAKQLVVKNHLILICGHYEGFDERVRETLVDEEISIGDYVLTGGEIPAMVLSDAVVRLLPGVLGNAETHGEESFYEGLLEYPQYTRPSEFRGMKVPEVLLSGHHEKIIQWRKTESIRRTWLRRPEMLEEANLSREERLYVKKLKQEK